MRPGAHVLSRDGTVIDASGPAPRFDRNTIPQLVESISSTHDLYRNRWRRTQPDCDSLAIGRRGLANSHPEADDKRKVSGL